MYDQLIKIIKDSENIVFFGGAGVSTESNIPDFRSSDGIYANHKKYKYAPEKMLSIDFFYDRPEAFYEFYFDQMIYPNAIPNLAHIALEKLEKVGKLKAVITQNIDGLHQKAGSRKVIELHGSVHRNYCMRCHALYNLDEMLKQSNRVPKCPKCNGVIKPDVVIYGEALNHQIMKDAIFYISNADVLIVGGTSLNVYPAAGLLQYFKGSKLVLINYEQDRKSVV